MPLSNQFVLLLFCHLFRNREAAESGQLATAFQTTAATVDWQCLMPQKMDFWHNFDFSDQRVDLGKFSEVNSLDPDFWKSPKKIGSGHVHMSQNSVESGHRLFQKLFSGESTSEFKSVLQKIQKLKKFIFGLFESRVFFDFLSGKRRPLLVLLLHLGHMSKKALINS